MFDPYRYVRPRTARKAAALLASEPGARALAGGTDLLVEMRARNLRPGLIVDLKGIPRLRGVTRRKGQVRIGALTTVTDLLESPLIAGPLAALREAAAVFGCHEVRNRATVGGNLANASPGAEFTVPLMALDAEVELQGASGPPRLLPLAEFLLGPGRTALAPGELVLAVEIPAVDKRLRTAYRRRARTRGMDLAGVSLAVAARPGAAPGHWKVTVSMGAVAGVPPRPAAAEALLSGGPLDPARVKEAGRLLVADLAPRATSLRATPAYKLAVLPVMLERMLHDLGLLTPAAWEVVA